MPSGFITFSQASADAATTITVDLAGLEAEPNKWHIHNFPVDGACSSTGGHFDPFGVEVPTYTTCTGDAAAKATGCYVGDLSGKFGTLGESASATYSDSSVSLFGINSIQGRGIVIHKTNGERWACGTARCRMRGAIDSMVSPKQKILLGNRGRRSERPNPELVPPSKWQPVVSSKETS